MTTKFIPPGFQKGSLPCQCGQVHPVPTQETLERWHTTQDRVPWGTDKHGPVYTNGVMEDALGLTPFINGWSGDGGYYVTPGPHAVAAKAVVESIDWARVRSVVDHFDVPFNRGDKPGMMFDRRLLVTMTNYRKLLRLCYTSVPKARLNELSTALMKTKKN